MRIIATLCRINSHNLSLSPSNPLCFGFEPELLEKRYVRKEGEWVWRLKWKGEKNYKLILHKLFCVNNNCPACVFAAILRPHHEPALQKQIANKKQYFSILTGKWYMSGFGTIGSGIKSMSGNNMHRLERVTSRTPRSAISIGNHRVQLFVLFVSHRSAQMAGFVGRMMMMMVMMVVEKKKKKREMVGIVDGDGDDDDDGDDGGGEEEEEERDGWDC